MSHWTRGDMQRASSDYDEGFHNGWLDRSCGLRLAVALESPNVNYAVGYRMGQIAHEHGELLP